MENKNWVELPNTIIYSNNLEDYTKLVYAHLEFHLFFQKEQELPSKNSISKILNLNTRTVTKALQELTEKGLLQDNNLYCLTKDNKIDETIFSNTEEFTIKEYASKIGGFTKVPLEILSSKDLSSGERMSWIRIKSVKLDKIHIRGIATSVNYSFNNLKRHIKSLNEKGYLIYDVYNGNKLADKYIYNMKLFEKSINANSKNAFEEEQKNESIETTKNIETEQVETTEATVAEASKAEKKIIIEFDYYYDDDNDYDDGYDYYYDEDYIPTEQIDNNTAINSDESKDEDESVIEEDNSIISNELEQLNSEKKQIVTKMNNNPNKASIYYTKLIEIDEKIAKLNKKAA